MHIYHLLSLVRCFVRVFKCELYALCIEARKDSITYTHNFSAGSITTRLAKYIHYYQFMSKLTIHRSMFMLYYLSELLHLPGVCGGVCGIEITNTQVIS